MNEQEFPRIFIAKFYYERWKGRIFTEKLLGLN
jgi:hypothetical protein